MSTREGGRSTHQNEGKRKIILYTQPMHTMWHRITGRGGGEDMPRAHTTDRPTGPMGEKKRKEKYNVTVRGYMEPIPTVAICRCC